MCVVSMVMDDYRDRTERNWPDWRSWELPLPQVSREEFEQFRKEFNDFKELYKKAQKYDIENNQPDCELDEKKQIIKSIAETLGVGVQFLQGGDPA